MCPPCRVACMASPRGTSKASPPALSDEGSSRGVFQDTELYSAFRWTTVNKPKLKAVTQRVREMIREHGNFGKSSVHWNQVQFFPDGLVVPSKKPRTAAAAYAWWKREVATPLGLDSNLGKFEAVPNPSQEDLAVACGQGPRQEQARVDPDGAFGAAAASSRQAPAEQEHPGNFPAFASLKLLRGSLRAVCGRCFPDPSGGSN